VSPQPSDAGASPTQTLLVEVRDFIAEVRLNRPETLNALTPDMGPAYAALLRELIPIRPFAGSW